MVAPPLIVIFRLLILFKVIETCLLDHTEPFLGTRLHIVVNFQYWTISSHVQCSELLLIFRYKLFHFTQPIILQIDTCTRDFSHISTKIRNLPGHKNICLHPCQPPPPLPAPRNPSPVFSVMSTRNGDSRSKPLGKAACNFFIRILALLVSFLAEKWKTYYNM